MAPHPFEASWLAAGKFCGHQTAACMSLAAILVELQGLRGEIQELADRVHTLEISQVDRSFSSPIRGPVTVNYLAASSPASEPAPAAATTSGYPLPVAEAAAGSCEQRPVGAH